VSFAGSVDETAEQAHSICPDHHYLESWSDVEPIAGLISLTQPAVRPLGDTRAVVESLGVWSGRPTSAHDLVRQRYADGWEHAVQAGYIEIQPPARNRAWKALPPARREAAPQSSGYTLVLHSSVAMLDGHHAHNPWLHELPDPITKITWDNCAALSPAAATSLAVTDGDIVRVESMELPVVIQPGQHDTVVAVALGYGRKASERFANIGPRWIDRQPTVNAKGRIGENAARFLSFEDGAMRYERGGVRISKTGRRIELAATQIHHTLEGGAIVQEIGLGEFGKPPEPAEAREELWPPDHPTPAHHWGMAVDLNACTGCSACVVACQVEN